MTVEFKRGSQELFYQTNFTESQKSLRFLSSTHVIKIAESRKAPRGIEKRKIDTIVKELLPLMPLTRRPFWFKLQESANNTLRDLNVNFK